MKLALLFAGQGAQKAGMGYDFYQNDLGSKKIYDSIKMDFDLKEMCFTDIENELNQTEYTQACVLATSLAIAESFKGLNIPVSAVGGLSLGEYSALCFAQALSLEESLDLVRKRGILMAHALPVGTSSMTAVLNAELKDIESILSLNEVKSIGLVQIANYNSPKQVVLSGEWDALKEVEKILNERSIGRVIPLKVSGAFHSNLLKDASLHLSSLLKNIHFKTPKLDVYYNFSGQKETFNPDLLVKQIYSSVRFTNMIEAMIDDGIDTFVEIGPGKTLSAFVKQINPNVNVYSLERYEQLEALKGLIQ